MDKIKKNLVLIKKLGFPVVEEKTYIPSPWKEQNV